MEQQTRWLTFSLFCSKPQWQNVVGQSIRPFVAAFPAHQLKGYRIALGYQGGEHIRLCLQVPGNMADEIAKYADQYFKAYFQTAPQAEAEQITGANKLFADFPGNTIQYGLYSAEELSNEALGDACFQQEQSALLLDILGSGTVHPEMLLNLSFLLCLSLVATTWQEGAVKLDDLMSVPFQLKAGDRSITDIKFISQRFEDSRYELVNIIQDVVCGGDKQPLWNARWKQICRSRMERARSQRADICMVEVYRQMLYGIEYRLCLNESTRLTIFHFIRRVTSVSL